MKKKLMTAIMTIVMAFSMSVCAFAGSWQQDETGWWWQRDDGSYPVDTWEWIDDDGDGIAECYYFDFEGYSDRDLNVWSMDGVIQHQAVSSIPDYNATQSTYITLGGSGSGWKTSVNLYPDGSFDGYYEYKGDITRSHAAQDYAIATFTGSFTNFQKVDDYTYSMILDTINTFPADVDVNGLDGQVYTLYLPGAYLGDLDIILNWTTSRYGNDIQNDGRTSAYFLISQKNGVNLASLEN